MKCIWISFKPVYVHASNQPEKRKLTQSTPKHLHLDTVQQLCYAETWNWFISGWEKKIMWNIACPLGNLLLNFTGQEQLCRPTNPLLANIFFALAKIACTSNFAIAIKLIDPLVLGYWTVALSLPVHVTVTCSNYNHINTFIIQSKYFSISDWLKSHW